MPIKKDEVLQRLQNDKKLLPFRIFFKRYLKGLLFHVAVRPDGEGSECLHRPKFSLSIFWKVTSQF